MLKGGNAVFHSPGSVEPGPFRNSARSGLDLWDGNVHSIKIEIHRKFKLAEISLKFSSTSETRKEFFREHSLFSQHQCYLDDRVLVNTNLSFSFVKNLHTM